MIGDLEDFVARLKNAIPQWMGEEAPIYTAFLHGYAKTLSDLYALQQTVRLQTRIKTATGKFLDLIACDYFDEEGERLPDEGDEAFRKRILALLLQERATRRGMIKAIELLTGCTPFIFEPCSGIDGMALNVPESGGLNVAGFLGSSSYPYQAWIDVCVPPGTGMSNFGGLNTFLFGLNEAGDPAWNYLGSSDLLKEQITDSAIYRLINAVKCFGTLMWVKINRGSDTPVSSFIEDDAGNILEDDDGGNLIDGD